MLIIRVISFGFWGSGIPLFGGSEDSKIHCYKKGETCEAGAEQIKMQLSVLDEPGLPNPFNGNR